MKCPYKKIIVTYDGDDHDRTITKKTMTGFGECYGEECPFFARNQFGTEWCNRKEGEQK